MSRAASVPLLKASLFLGAALFLIGPIVHVLKVTHISYEAGAWTYYVGFPVVTLFFLASWLFDGRGSLRVTQIASGMSVIALAMIVVSVPMTLILGGDPIDIGGNALRIAFVLFALCAMCSHPRAFTETFEKMFALVARLGLVVGVLTVSFTWAAIGAGSSVYLGLQNTPLLVSLAYALLVRKSGTLVLLSLVLIVASGKRGVILAALLMLVGLATTAGGKFRPVRLLLAVMTTAAVILGGITLMSSFPEPLQKRFVVFLTDDSFDITKASAGRDIEIESALRDLELFPAGWVVGRGLGATIEKAEGERHSTTHFSPLALTNNFGAIVALFTYVILGSVIARGLITRRNIPLGLDAPMLRAVALVLLGEVIFSLTAFSVTQSFMLWTAYAYLMCMMFLIRATYAHRQDARTTTQPVQIRAAPAH